MNCITKNIFCLENVIHTDQERMISSEQYFFLELCIFDLVVIYQNIFTKGLHGVNLFPNKLFHKKYFTKTTFAQNLDDSKVFH
jgi:hypothetical protein